MEVQQVQQDAPVSTTRTAMRWTPVMSAFVLKRFADLVGQGVKTDKGFKEVHLNSVARSLSEFSGLQVSGQQVYNHLRKWRQKWIRICRLKDLSGAHWDENTFTIILDDEHLIGHTRDNPKDAEFLNVPIENYVQMQIIYGAGQATGKYAMASNEPLGSLSDLTEGVGASEETGPAADFGSASASPAHSGFGAGSSSGSSGKKRRLSDEEVGIMTGLTGAVTKLAEAVQAPVVVQTTDVHPDLYQICMNIPGFTDEDLIINNSETFLPEPGTVDDN